MDFPERQPEVLKPDSQRTSPTLSHGAFFLVLFMVPKEKLESCGFPLLPFQVVHMDIKTATIRSSAKSLPAQGAFLEMRTPNF